ncbi:MAG TPA: 3-oxoacyl-ACP reductase FabG [Clostridiaceae bacterium]|nr:3-oxoacyl-ACP reductase FabG [Clostridiaceae bacterium]
MTRKDRPTVLITGASGGIGRATARRFAAAGFQIILHGFRHMDTLADLVETFRDNDVPFMTVRADISDRTQVFSMVAAIQEECGSIDVLVNNAGIAQQKLVTEVTEEEWQYMLGVNLSGPFYVCQAVLPDMIRRHSGHIINVSSMWGMTGASCEVPYSSVKAGLIGLTRSLAKEVGPAGITVNCVAPGVINTPMNADLPETVVSELVAETPLCRIGFPHDVANAIYYLASEEASFITGQVIGVNGGMVIG